MLPAPLCRPCLDTRRNPVLTTAGCKAKISYPPLRAVLPGTAAGQHQPLGTGPASARFTQSALHQGVCFKTQGHSSRLCPFPALLALAPIPCSSGAQQGMAASDGSSEHLQGKDEVGAVCHTPAAGSCQEPACPTTPGCPRAAGLNCWGDLILPAFHPPHFDSSHRDVPSRCGEPDANAKPSTSRHGPGIAKSRSKATRISSAQ